MGVALGGISIHVVTDLRHVIFVAIFKLFLVFFILLIVFREPVIGKVDLLASGLT
jgi:hypothetical protein